MPPRFVRTREDFTCGHCGAYVRGNGYTNHCPQCLWSKHVDAHPGDRAATCGALMEPVAAVSKGEEIVVVQWCTGCGHAWRNRSATNDHREVLLSLFGEPAYDRDPTSRRGVRGRAG